MNPTKIIVLKEYVREVFLVMQLPKRFKEDLSYSRNFSRNYLYKRVKTWTVNQKVQLIILSGRQTLGKEKDILDVISVL